MKSDGASSSSLGDAGGDVVSCKGDVPTFVHIPTKGLAVEDFGDDDDEDDDDDDFCVVVGGGDATSKCAATSGCIGTRRMAPSCR